MIKLGCSVLQVMLPETLDATILSWRLTCASPKPSLFQLGLQKRERVEIGCV